MIWMLTLTIMYSSTVHTISVPFTSQQACLYAGQEHARAINGNNRISATAMYSCANGGVK